MWFHISWQYRDNALPNRGNIRAFYSLCTQQVEAAFALWPTPARSRPRAVSLLASAQNYSATRASCSKAMSCRVWRAATAPWLRGRPMVEPQPPQGPPLRQLRPAHSPRPHPLGPPLARCTTATSDSSRCAQQPQQACEGATLLSTLTCLSSSTASRSIPRRTRDCQNPRQRTSKLHSSTSLEPSASVC